MNRTIAATLIAFAASSAFAEGPIESIPAVSAQPRAQVQTELQQFQASGVNPWAKHYDQLAGFRSGKTRAQVVTEFLQSRGETAALTGEDSGSAYLATRRHGATAPVVAGQPVNAQ